MYGRVGINVDAEYVRCLRGKRTFEMHLSDVSYWHLADQDTALKRHPLRGPKQTLIYADRARYTDAFDREVCRMISGTV